VYKKYPVSTELVKHCRQDRESADQVILWPGLRREYAFLKNVLPKRQPVHCRVPYFAMGKKFSLRAKAVLWFARHMDEGGGCTGTTKHVM